MKCLRTEEEKLRQLYKLQSNAVIDLQFRRQSYNIFFIYENNSYKKLNFVICSCQNRAFFSFTFHFSLFTFHFRPKSAGISPQAFVSHL